METYGEDPYLTGKMAVQFIRGMQGSDPKYLKTVATAKHFAVHSGPESERHTFNAIVSEDRPARYVSRPVRNGDQGRPRLLGHVCIQTAWPANPRARTHGC